MKAHIDPKDLIGHKLIDDEGSKIGTIDQVYLDDQTREPEWVSVNTGMFGGRGSFVPLDNARTSGEDFQVPYNKSKVKEAPPLDVDTHLSVTDEERLYQYYGVSARDESDHPAKETAHGPAGETAVAGTAPRPSGQDRDRAARKPSDTMPRSTAPPREAQPDDKSDATMTRCEEQLHVDTERYESGHVRLHKYVVTETVNENVTISHEEVQVEREPISVTDRGTLADTTLGEAERDIVLHAERAVPHKETVPVERVRLRMRQVREEVPVAEDLRKERIEVENDTVMATGRSGDMSRKQRPT